MSLSVSASGSGGRGLLPIIVLAIVIVLLILFARKFNPKLKNINAKIKSGEGKKFNPLFYILCGIGFIIDFVIVGFIYNWNFSTGEAIGIMALLIIPGILTQCLYFLPYIIAHYRLHQQQTAIFVLNLFAGWTIVVWIISLVWAFTTKKEAQIVAPASSNAKQIEEFKELLDKGIITEEEFNEKKKQLLQ